MVVEEANDRTITLSEMRSDTQQMAVIDARTRTDGDSRRRRHVIHSK